MWIIIRIIHVQAALADDNICLQMWRTSYISQFNITVDSNMVG